MSDTIPSREFSGDLACCNVCGYSDARTEYVPRKYGFEADRVDLDGYDWPTSAFLKRICLRCGYEWAEACLGDQVTCARCKGSTIDPEDSDPDVNAFAPCRDCQFPPQHIGGNAEDCPACTGTNPPYPFICPGNDTGPCSKCRGKGRFLNSWRLWQECGECTS